MSFSKKKITLIFKLGKGQFGETGADTVTIEGLRISAKIVKTGSAAVCECQLRIFGLTPTVYNALTSIYPITQGAQQNIVTVMAGDDASNMPIVFIGQILLAQIDLNSQPDSVMNVIAQTAYIQSLAPIAATSYPNGVSVVDAMKNIASVMGLQFEPNNVTAQLTKSSFAGTARQQALKILEAAPNVQWNSCDNGVLAIWQDGGPRNPKGTIPVVSPETGMIGYPSFSNIGLGLKTRYNPNIEYYGQIQVKSSLQVANLNAIWTVFGLAHTLESEMPDGQWMSEIQAQNYKAIGSGNG
jgi:hypothetical protein